MSSKVVDQRVVQMEFDNRRFEKNVSTTMSSLDKLKQKLNFTGAAKGFDNINSAAKNVNMNGLASAVDTVKHRFSALEVMGVTALANITNSAVNAGKRIVSALTIDPVKTGFSEYETQINAIQTIMANTSSKGTTLDDVTKALDTLNTYADKTIYNFTEMTRNIGTFTAAGVDLNTSVNAIQGIANLAAVSGSTSQQASTAMYQLSQALASGTVKLMDWNSVVNAGMGGEVFQNALKETARVHGVAIDEIIEKNGSFRDSLHEEWLTTDILTETLEKFTMATEGVSEAEIEANKQKLKSIGYTEKQIEEIFKLGDTATNAATKVKTFSQLWDTLKESAQSGWTQTWEIIVGDFYEAQDFLTNLSDGIGGFINKMSEWRNNLLEGALGSKWGQLTSKINEAGISTDDFNDKLKKVAKEHGIAVDDLIKEHGSLEEAMSKGAISTDLIKETLKGFAKEAKTSGESTEDLNDKLEYFQNVVSKVWRGDYGNMEDRFKALAEAGYDYHKVQSLVNKTVDGHKLTLEDLSDEQLISIGYTKEQVKAIKALAEEAEKSGTPLNELIQTLDKPSGRTLLIESLKNAAQGLVKSFTAIKDAWTEIFPPMTSNTLYNMIVAINDLSKHLKMSDETADKLKRTFKGLFALVDIIFTFIGGPVKMALKAVLELLGLADIPILDLTAGLGDAIVKFRDWIKENNIFVKGVKLLIEYLKKAANGIKGWLTSAKEPGMGEDIIAGLVGGIWKGMKAVGEAALEIGKKIVNTVKDFLGIHSPSTVFFEIGKNIIQGLLNGLKEGGTLVWNLGKTIVTKLTEIFSELSLEKVLAIGLGAGMFIGLFKMLDILGSFAKAAAGIVENVGDVLDGIGDMFTGIGKMFKGMGRMFTSIAILNIVIAVAILAKAVVELATLDVSAGKLWNAVAIIAVLGVIVAGLSALMAMANKLGGVNLKSTLALAAISGALFLLVMALSKLVTVKLDDVVSTLAVLGALVGALIGIVALMALLAKGSGEIVKAGGTLIAMSAAMLIMLAVVKMASKMDETDLKKGLNLVLAFGSICAGMIIVSKLAGKSAKDAGKMIRKISVSMLLMLAVVKLASMIPEAEVKRGMAVVALIGGLFLAILLVSRTAGQSSNDAGKAILRMSIAMLAMVAVMKIASGMSKGEIQRGLVVMSAIGLLFAAIIAVSKLAGEHAAKAGVMLLAMSGAMLAMVAVVFLFSQMETSGLAKGIAAVTALASIFAGLIAVTKLAKGDEIFKTLLMLTIAVALLGGLVIGMSFIDPSRLAGATAALAILIAIFAGLVAVTKFANVSGKMIATMASMMIIVSALAGILVMLSKLDPGNAIANAKALSLLLATMSLVLIPLTMFGSGYKNALKGALTLAAMAIPLAGIGLVLAMMSALKVQDAMPNVKALATLMTLMTLLLIPLTVIGAFGTAAIAGVGVLATMAVPLALVGLVLAMMAALKVQEAMPNVVALSTLLTVMTLLLIPLTLIGAGSAMAMAGVLALTAMMVPLAAAVLVLALMKSMGVDNAIDSVNSLSTLLTTLTLLLIPLTLIGAFAPAAIAGIGVLITFLGAIAGLMAATSALVTLFPGLEEFLSRGIPLLEQLAYVLGSVIGNFVGGLSSGIAAGLPSIGQNLSDFMTNASAFIEGAKKVDDTVLAGVGILAGAIAALVVLDTYKSVFSSEDSFATMGTELSNFMTNCKGFVEGAKNLDEGIIDGVKALAEAIIILTAADLINGLSAFLGLTDGNALGTFGAQLPQLGKDLATFSASLTEAGLDEDKIKMVQNAATAVKTLAEVSATIPNSGGWLGAIVGDNDLGVFAEQFPKLGAGLASFVSNIGSFSEDQLALVKNAAEAITTLATAASDIPNQGGWVGAIMGENTMDLFSTQFPKLGAGLASFVSNIGTFDEAGEFGSGQLETIKSAANAVVTLATAADRIPNQGGWVAAIVGDNNLGTFATQFPLLGAGIRGFVGKIGELTSGELVSSARALQVVESVTDLANVDVSGLSKKVKSLGDTLETFGESIVAFSESMHAEGMTVSLKNAVDGVRDLVDALKVIPADKATHLKTISDSLEGLGKNGLKSFVEAFAGKSATAQVRSAATEMVKSFVDGVKDKGSSIANIFLLSASSAYHQLISASVYGSFTAAGKYLASGFAVGIRQDTYKAVNAAAAMVNAVNREIQKVAVIKSPSRMTYEDGEYMVQGLVNALLDGTSGVSGAANKLADSAITGLSGAISRISEIIEHGIDTQPTIRPVLDLDDVRAGASQIGGMLGMSPSVGVLSNVNSIASAMNKRGQNGANSDVVSELGKLRKDISTLKHVSYNIEGINYGEGSEVAEAIETLVRAALMERRV